MRVEYRQSTPYVGPRPFERQENNIFFGRDREVSALLSLIIAHRTVLLYAQSGAGKTSLINASLIPQLEEEMFKVLPLARVKGVIPQYLKSKNISNLFVFNTLLSWVDKDFELNRLARITIKDFLKYINNGNERNELPTPPVIIFDQFEELFSAYPGRWEDRKQFFVQVADALKADPLLRVVFVIREDYIARLEPYTHHLPDKLRTRFRLQCLKRNASLAAVQGPLNESHRSFKQGVAETLVEDLLKIRVESFNGETTVVTGEFVEPVQLQVVCQSLWEALPPETNVITEDDLQSFGDVNQALQQFYENSIEKAVQQINIEESILRSWFKNTLITPSGTRGTVYRGQEETGRIPNAAVNLLEGLHLIRGEFRGGARWYELTHDRFIDPILKSNQEWLSKIMEGEQSRQWLELRAAEWLASGSSSDRLLNEGDLLEAEQWLKIASLSDQQYCESLVTFITASRAELERQRAEVKAGAARRFRGLALALVGVTILVFGLAYVALVQAGKAHKAKAKAVENLKLAEENERTAIMAKVKTEQALKQAALNAQLAKEEERKARKAEAEALAAKQEAEKLARIAKEREAEALVAEKIAEDKAYIARKAEDKALAAKNKIDRLYRLGSIALVLSNEAQRQQQMGKHELAALLARQAYLFDQTTGNKFQNEVFNSLRKVLNSDYLSNNRCIGGPNFLSDHTAWVRTVAFQPDGNYLASCSNDGTVRLWSFQQNKAKYRILDQFSTRIRALAFSHDGQLLAYGCDDHIIRLKNLDKMELPAKVLYGHKAGVWAIAFSADGTKMASGSADGSVLLWDLNSPNTDVTLLFNHITRIKTLAFSPNNRMLIVGCDDGKIQQWILNGAAQKPRLLQIKPVHKGSVNSLAFSMTGDTLASGGSDATVKLWRVHYRDKSLELIKILHGHEGPVNSVAFSSKSKLLASGSSDRTVRLWDLRNLTNRPVVLADHDRWVLTVAFNSTGDKLASGTGNKTIYIWPTRAEFLADIINRTVTRNLSWEEWKSFVGENIEYECTCKHLPPASDLPESIRSNLDDIESSLKNMDK